MNLNVFTEADAMRAVDAVRADSAHASDVANENVSTAKAGKAPQVTADDLYGKILKYIPAPLIGIYLLLTNAIIAAKPDDGTPNLWLLGGVLLFFVVATVVFLRVRDIRRVRQIALSVVSFLVFSMGSPGIFTYVDWWQPLYATITLGLVGVIIAVYPMPPLEADADQTSTDGTTGKTDAGDTPTDGATGTGQTPITESGHPPQV
jgi:hypothetical protein